MGGVRSTSMARAHLSDGRTRAISIPRYISQMAIPFQSLDGRKRQSKLTIVEDFSMRSIGKRARPTSPNWQTRSRFCSPAKTILTRFGRKATQFFLELPGGRELKALKIRGASGTRSEGRNGSVRPGLSCRGLSIRTIRGQIRSSSGGTDGLNGLKFAASLTCAQARTGGYSGFLSGDFPFFCPLIGFIIEACDRRRTRQRQPQRSLITDGGRAESL